MGNRRQGERRLSLPSLKGIGEGVAKKVRVPRLRSGNRRRRSTLRMTAAETTAKTQKAPAAGRSKARTIATFLAWASPVLIAIVAFATPLLGVRAYQYVMSTGHFHVREVIVEGHVRLTPDDVRELAGIEPGTHILAADVDLMSAKLIVHPWIGFAHVTRELPDRLLIQVVEHVPVGYLALGTLWLVDDQGDAYAPAGPDDRLDLPIITGIAPGALVDPSTRDDTRAEIRSAVNLTRLYAAMGLAGRWPIGELRLSDDRGMTLVLSEIGTEVVLGNEPWREKLFRLEWVLENLRSQDKVAEYIVLDAWGDEDTRRRDDGRVIVKADLAPSRGQLMERAAERARQAERQILGLPLDPDLFGPSIPPALYAPPSGGPDASDEPSPAALSGGRPAMDPADLNDGEED